MSKTSAGREIKSTILRRKQEKTNEHRAECKQLKRGKECEHTTRGNYPLWEARETFGWEPRSKEERDADLWLRRNGITKKPVVGWCTIETEDEWLDWLIWDMKEWIGWMGASSREMEIIREIMKHNPERKLEMIRRRLLSEGYKPEDIQQAMENFLADNMPKEARVLLRDINPGRGG